MTTPGAERLYRAQHLAADDDRMGEMARQVAEQEKVIEELVEAMEFVVRVLELDPDMRVGTVNQTLRVALARAEEYRKAKEQ